MEEETKFQDIPLEIIFIMLERNPDILWSLIEADPYIKDFVYGNNQRILNLLIKNTRRFVKTCKDFECTSGDLVLNDLKHGVWEVRHDNIEKRLIKSSTYYLDVLDGKELMYDVHGDIVIKSNFKSGKLDGKYTIYHSDEDDFSDYTFIEGVLNGESSSRGFYSRFNTLTYGNFINGIYSGKWTTKIYPHDDNPIVYNDLYTYFYDDGRITTVNVMEPNITLPCEQFVIEGVQDTKYIIHKVDEYISPKLVGRTLQSYVHHRNDIPRLEKIFCNDNIELSCEQSKNITLRENDKTLLVIYLSQDDLLIDYVDNQLVIDKKNRIKGLVLAGKTKMTFHESGRITTFELRIGAIIEEYWKENTKYMKLSLGTDIFIFSLKEDGQYLEYAKLANKGIILDKNIIRKCMINIQNIGTCNLTNNKIIIKTKDNKFDFTRKLKTLSFSIVENSIDRIQSTGLYRNGFLNKYIRTFDNGIKDIFKYDTTKATYEKKNKNILVCKITTYPHSDNIHYITQCDEDGLYLSNVETYNIGEKKIT